MRELRQDPIVGRWVLISTERGQRPSDFVRSAVAAKAGGRCPFCPGNEEETPPEITRLPAKAGTWEVRVVPNKYAALETAPSPLSEGIGGTPPFVAHAAVGAHEVIIETPDHQATLADFSDERLLLWLTTFQERFRVHRQNPEIAFIQAFKNHGGGAGATQAHPHSQLIALPVVPRRVSDSLAGAARYLERHGVCVFCDLAARERALGERFIAAQAGATAFCPWAPRRPYEAWIVPSEHGAHFEEATIDSLAATASLLGKLLRSVERALGAPSYNLVIDTAPTGPASYHWNLQLLPALSQLAGFEWGSGVYINAVAPETAAAALRGGLE